jgi:hypothetical protein
MRRTLIIAGAVATFLLAVAGIAVNLLVAGAGELPPPDPALPVTLADGRVLPLSELLDRLRRAPAQDAPPVPLAPSEEPAPLLPLEASPEAFADPHAELARIRIELARRSAGIHGPLVALAEEQLELGNLEQAAALYLSVRPGEQGYGFARRRLGWEVLARGRGQPELGVAHVHEALRAEPLDGNSWQDAARVYGAALGFDLDGWD